MSVNVTAKIVAFAAHVGNPNRDPVEKACNRGWLDASAAPTQDGMALVSALDEQLGTRSTFR
ncbi:MAG: hypothetical protein AAGL89_17325 [Pseudomonadota bacterium]